MRKMLLLFALLSLTSLDGSAQDKPLTAPKTKIASSSARSSSNLRQIDLAAGTVISDEVLVGDLIQIILDPTDVDTLSVKTNVSDGDAVATFAKVSEKIGGKDEIVMYCVAQKTGTATVSLDYMKGGVAQHKLVKLTVILTGLAKVIDVDFGSSSLISGAKVGDILRVKIDRTDADDFSIIVGNDVLKLEGRPKIAGTSYAIFAIQKAGELNLVIRKGQTGWIAGGTVTT
jgi:hypothetical protein